MIDHINATLLISRFEAALLDLGPMYYDGIDINDIDNIRCWLKYMEVKKELLDNLLVEPK
jgi:hypothetical protein